MMENGPIAGFPVLDIEIELFDGGFHAVDSSAVAFELAARGAYRQSMPKAGPELIEPIMKVDVFTPEDFSEEQLMMKEAVKEFNEREIIAHKDRFEAKDYKLTEEVMKKAGELGFLGVAVPEAYGGMGMGFVSTMLTCEYISSGNGSLSTAFGAHTGIGTMPITLYGTCLLYTSDAADD